MHQPIRSLRSSNQFLLSTPRTRLRLTDQSFHIAAPTIWNSIPLDIKLQTNTKNSKAHSRHIFLTSSTQTTNPRPRDPAPKILTRPWRYIKYWFDLIWYWCGIDVYRCICGMYIPHIQIVIIHIAYASTCRISVCKSAWLLSCSCNWQL